MFGSLGSDNCRYGITDRRIRTVFHTKCGTTYLYNSSSRPVQNAIFKLLRCIFP